MGLNDCIPFASAVDNHALQRELLMENGQQRRAAFRRLHLGGPLVT
jgi:hypothetical protein